jgi:cytochrome c oxidase subunit 2
MMNKTIFLDAAYNWQLGFQDPATAIMEGIINFHHDLFFFLVVILIFVVRIMVRCISLFGKFNPSDDKKPIIFTHAPTLEIVWTLIPAFILAFIAVPSFSLLYSMDEIVDPLLTVKVIGHQWYWSYELINPNEFFYIDSVGSILDEDNQLDTNYNFDSYMIADDDLQLGHLRLLEVDNRLHLPIEVNIRLLITSGDVLHSWAVPSLGVKLDACPGRLNQTSVYIKRPAAFYGQCSEICGINHGFMPIVVNGVDIAPEFDINQTIFNSIYPFFMAVFYPNN